MGAAQIAVALLVVGAVAGAALALLGAFMIRRATHHASVALRQADERLRAGRASVAANIAAGAAKMAADSRAGTERALWTLAGADARMDALQVDLRDRRAASDRLRTSITRNRGALVRVRNSARLLIRAIELRREFQG